MARLTGQIDVSKNEAILDAAMDVMGERGLAASMEEIARRAGVSKQTIYNHYGSKAELARAMSERRALEVVEILESPGAVEHPQQTLAAYARLLLTVAINARSMAIYRMAIAAATTLPEVARVIYEAGPKASRQRLAEYLRLENAAGRLCCPDPMQAAYFFGGLVLGAYQTPALLGVETPPTGDEMERVAEEAARRFMRAYAV